MTNGTVAPARAHGQQHGLVELRDYQQAALAAVEAAESRGVRRQLIALPTGTGKTVVFAELIRRRGGRALVLVHRDELLAQAVEKLAMAGVDQVGIVKADRHEIDAPVVVASVQTISRVNRLATLADDFATVVVDEAHHATAESYRRVLEHVGAFRADGPLLLGVTATAERADGVALGEIFQEIVYEGVLLDMIRRGYLAPLRAIQIGLAADFGALHTRAGDFIESETEQLLLDANAPAEVARAFQQYAAERKALLFTPTVRVAHAMVDALRGRGVRADAVDGATPITDRRAILARFRHGDTRVIANCAVLTEGYDEPSADCIIVARPTRSRPLYIQMIGRGTRRYPGKPDCVVLDMVGATNRHDLVTTATLFGVPATGAIEHSVLDALDDAQARRQADEERAERGQLVGRAIDLFRARPLNWIPVNVRRFALAVGDGGTLLLTATADGWWSVSQLARDRREITLKTGLNLAYAQGFAEDHARQLGAGRLLDREAAWRTTPASDKQIETLRRCRIPVRAGLTKGEAADLLTATFARRRA